MRPAGCHAPANPPSATARIRQFNLQPRKPDMNRLSRSVMLAISAASCSAAAVAGEVNGSTSNPKEDFSKGMSFCKFSGLNDDPTAPIDGPNGPGGRVQNFGHTKQIFDT